VLERSAGDDSGFSLRLGERLSRILEQSSVVANGLSFLSLKYGAVDIGEGLRTSCRIFWRVRQSAGVREGRRESVSRGDELGVSSPRDGELMLELSCGCGRVSSGMG
jgi:hypothetical protein